MTEDRERAEFEAAFKKLFPDAWLKLSRLIENHEWLEKAGEP